MCYAYDTRTRFPCVQCGDFFVSLLPLTKMQVEEYVWRGAAAKDRRLLSAQPSNGYQDQLLDMLGPRRIEAYCDRLEGGRYQFTQEVHWTAGNGTRPIRELLRRQSPEKARREEALLATNLAHCVYGYQYDRGAPVPQSWTPMDRILRWMEARDPQDADGDGPLPTPEEYQQMVDAFRNRCAKDMLQEALDGLPGLSRGARRLLKFLSTKPRFAKEQGLPFLASGIWEMTSEKAPREVFAGRDAGPTWKPVAVGSSPFLPSIPQSAADSRQGPSRHLILIEHHPAIGCRPVFTPNAVTPSEAAAQAEDESSDGKHVAT